LHGVQAQFDVAMIGLDPVIAVRSRALPATAMQLTFILQLANGSRATQTVSGEDMWWAVVRVGQCLLQEDLAASWSRFSDR
jgi:hypothetical protein